MSVLREYKSPTWLLLSELSAAPQLSEPLSSPASLLKDPALVRDQVICAETKSSRFRERVIVFLFLAFLCRLLPNVAVPQASVFTHETVRVCCRFSTESNTRIAFLVLWTVRHAAAQHRSTNSTVHSNSAVDVCINHTISTSEHLLQCTGKQNANQSHAVSGMLKLLPQSAARAGNTFVENDPFALDLNAWAVVGLLSVLLVSCLLAALLLLKKCRRRPNKSFVPQLVSQPTQSHVYAPLNTCTCSQHVTTLPCRSSCQSPVINRDLLRTSTYRSVGTAVDDHIHHARQSSQSPSNESGVVDGYVQLGLIIFIISLTISNLV